MIAAIEAGLFTLRETAVLSRVGEDRVRREIERKVIEPERIKVIGEARRLFFGEPGVLYFSMLQTTSGKLDLAPELRTRAASLLRRLHADPQHRRAWVEQIERGWSEAVSPIVHVNWEALIAEIAPRIDLYREGRARMHSDHAILAGEPVFRGTRLAVRHIGGMRIKGEAIERIIEDYPYLTPRDVEFAALYTEANPVVGRPKAAGSAARA